MHRNRHIGLPLHHRVSIPFKRESIYAQKGKRYKKYFTKVFQFPSNGKAHVHPSTPNALPSGITRFNSLQTGKHMCTEETASMPTKAERSFNSLQTGKHMCTGFFRIPLSMLSVLFQFPSNGKAHVHSLFSLPQAEIEKVFQFPSNGKAHVHSLFSLPQAEIEKVFQFPSNGKAHVHSKKKETQ